MRPRLHLGNLSLVQSDGADELHIEVAKPRGADTRLTHRGKGLGQKLVERLARLVALAEERRLALELLVGHRLIGGLQLVDLVDDLAVTLDVLVRADGEQLGHETHGRSFSRIRRRAERPTVRFTRDYSIPKAALGCEGCVYARINHAQTRRWPGRTRAIFELLERRSAGTATPGPHRWWR